MCYLGIVFVKNLEMLFLCMDLEFEMFMEGREISGGVCEVENCWVGFVVFVIVWVFIFFEYVVWIIFRVKVCIGDGLYMFLEGFVLDVCLLRMCGFGRVDVEFERLDEWLLCEDCDIEDVVGFVIGR